MDDLPRCPVTVIKCGPSPVSAKPTYWKALMRWSDTQREKHPDWYFWKDREIQFDWAKFKEEHPEMWKEKATQTENPAQMRLFYGPLETFGLSGIILAFRPEPPRRKL